MSTELAVRVLSFTENAANFQITGAESFETANQRRQAAKALIKEIEATFDPIVDTAKAALAEAKSQRDKYLLPAMASDLLYKNLMLAWSEKERKRIEAEQERQRREAQKLVDDEKLKRAQEASDNGEAHKVNEILEAPVVVTPPPAPAMPTAKGFSTRMDWDFTVEDAKLVPTEYRTIDLVKIRGVVKAMKGEARIPGIRVFQRAVAVSR